MRFEIATLQDLPKIVEIYNQSIPLRMATADTKTVSVLSKVKWFLEYKKDKYPLWIAKNEDNLIVGWVGLKYFKQRDAYDQTAEISIYIHNDFKGKGIGKACLAHALKNAANFDIYNIMGVIFSHNKASISLYSSFGFKKWGTFPNVTKMDGNIYSVDIWGINLDHSAK